MSWSFRMIKNRKKDKFFLSLLRKVNQTTRQAYFLRRNWMMNSFPRTSIDKSDMAQQTISMNHEFFASYWHNQCQWIEFHWDDESVCFQMRMYRKCQRFLSTYSILLMFFVLYLILTICMILYSKIFENLISFWFNLSKYFSKEYRHRTRL